MNLSAPEESLIPGQSAFYLHKLGFAETLFFITCLLIIRLTAKLALKYVFTEWIMPNRCFIVSAVGVSSAILVLESDSAQAGRRNQRLETT